MKEYTCTAPEFSSTIQIVETKDPAHADKINMAPTQLLENTLSNREILEMLLQQTNVLEERIGVLEDDCTVENGTITLTNTSKYPFNNSVQAIALAKARNTTNYLVECAVESYSGGPPGDIVVSEKAVNGFKLEFDGSADSVTIKYIVKGGILS